MKRHWSRYPTIGVELDLLLRDALLSGMYITDAYKPGFCVTYTVGLFGTSAQMRATETRWLARRATVPPRKPRTAWGEPRPLPREEWLRTVKDLRQRRTRLAQPPPVGAK